MTGTYSSFERISTFDHRTEVFGNVVPQLSPFEIILANQSAYSHTLSKKDSLEAI
jgi:hypothetical protein